MTLRLARTTLASMATVLCLVASAHGQTRPDAAPTARTASGDWNTGCSGEAAAKVCDAVQSLVDNASHEERIRVGVAKQKATGAYGVQIKTPLGLRLDSGAVLRFSEVTGDAIVDIKFNRCLADGCYAERPLSAAEYAKVRAAGKMELIVLDLASKPIIVGLSVKGLKAALDRL